MTIAAGLAAGHELHAVGAATSGLASTTIGRAGFGSPDDIAPVLERLLGSVRTGCERASGPPVLLVDDLDLLDDLALARLWERVAACPELRIVAAVDVAAMTGFTSNPIAVALKRSRRMLVLQPDDPGEFLQATGVRLDVRPGMRWVPGRGVLVADRRAHIVQVAVGDDPVGRTRVRPSGTVSGVTLLTTQSLRTAAVATATPR